MFPFSHLSRVAKIDILLGELYGNKWFLLATLILKIAKFD
jgi:hypothetical protein